MIENAQNPITAPVRSLDPAQTSEKHLLTRVRRNEQAAMGEIFDQYSGMIYSVAFRVLNDEALAEDVMLEVLIKVWREPHSFLEGRGSLGAWLAVITRNKAIDRLLHRKPSDPVEEVDIAGQPDLATKAQRAAIVKTIRGALAQMPREQQKMLDMAFFEGLSHSQIADTIGASLPAVKAGMRSALSSLREASRK